MSLLVFLHILIFLFIITFFIRDDRSEYPIAFSVEAYKVVLKADNKGNEDNLILFKNRGYFFDISNIEKVKQILSEYELLTSKEKTIEKKESIIKEIEQYSLGNKLTFNLKDSNELVYYKLLIKEGKLDLSYFNKNYYTLEDMSEEKSKFDKYIKQI